MYYQFYEWNHALLSPARAVNDAVRLYYKNPLNPMAHTEIGRQIAAAGDVFERLTRRYGKPEFGIESTAADGVPVAVSEEVVWERPFCRLLHFKRSRPADAPRQPNLVLVAPMSGHYATLLRGTVAALLPEHEVHITDWADARRVPLAMGSFDLDDYIDYIEEIVDHFGGDVHLVAVCQPAVPVFAATALMEARGARRPKSITLMGGPIDTSQNPTEVNIYAARHDLDWFRDNVIMSVPFPHPGFLRWVYPGFLQLTGFMTMNLDRHMSAHYDYFDHLVSGDGDGAEKHREFYDEYLSVMDLTAEFYLQTVDTVFIRQALPRGAMMHRDERVDPRAIRETPILTVEGENDDISGLGQTRAAHRLTPNLPEEKHRHYEQAGVGHYGVFNGSRFRREIAPRIAAFVARWDDAEGTEPLAPVPEDVGGVATAAVKAADAAAGALENAAGAAATALDGAAEAMAATAEAGEDGTAPAEATDAPGTAGRDDAPADALDDGAQAAPDPASQPGAGAASGAPKVKATAATLDFRPASHAPWEEEADAARPVRTLTSAHALIAAEEPREDD